MRILLSLAVLASLAAPSVAFADQIGNPAVSAPVVDGNTNDSYVLNQTFACVGCQVTSYEFYGAQSGTITPILLTAVTTGGTTTFTVTGVGTTRSGTAVGVDTFSFGLVTGSDITTAGTYFGFYNSFGSNVAFTNGDSSSGGAFLLGASPAVYQATYSEGNTMTHNAEGQLNDRVYSINATATSPSAVPEPSSFALLGTGVLSVAGLVRRKIRS